MLSNAMTSNLFLVLLFGGAGSCVWLMVLLNRRELYATDTPLMRQARRASLASVAWGMLWAAQFYAQTSWTPWPPYLLIVSGVDLFLLISIISAHQRIRAKAGSGAPLTVFHR
jgi:hypothetical protein